MKSLLNVVAIVACLTTPLFAQGPQFGSATLGSATSYQEGLLVPVPEAGPPAGAVMEPHGVPYTMEPGCELFQCVEYKDLHRIAPCAVPMIVQVLDPCYDPCTSCGPKCVCVEICVPPCSCPPKIKVTRKGWKVEYDYGKYEIEITSNPRKGTITVDYDS